MGVGAQRHAAAVLPRERPGNHCKEAGWVPGPVGTCVKNLASIGIRLPDRPVGSEALYRLSYPGYPVVMSTGTCSCEHTIFVGGFLFLLTNFDLFLWSTELCRVFSS